MSQVSRDTFEKAELETKFLMIFDIMTDHGKLMADHIAKQDLSCDKRANKCDKRFIAIERRKKIDTAISGTTGFAGGFLAVVLKKIIGA